MAERVEVRVGDVTDVPAVLALERAIEEAPHWTEEEYRGIVSPREGAVARCLFVARAPEELVGFAVGSVVAGTGAIESVAVGAGVRRRGMGASLCKAVIEWCLAEGADGVELEVRAGSAGARSMYGELGFAVTGRRSGYYAGPVEDAVLMRLRAGGSVGR